MKHFIRINIFLIFLLICKEVFSAPVPCYLYHQRDLVNLFAQEMKAKYGLYYSGRAFPDTLNEIELSFETCQRISVEQARELEVNVIQRFLSIINNSVQIRPYLPEFPYKVNRLTVSIEFPTNQDKYPVDGSVARVFLIKNRIFYRKAELKKIKSTMYNFDGSISESEEWEEERLVALLDETYEEALQKVKASASCSKK